MAKPDNTIEATYRVVTPMFLGGADNEKAEFRLPSFKGVLRFWWRALAWRRVTGELQEELNRPPSTEETLAEIKSQENELFGSTKAQAKCLMHAETQGLGSPIEAGRVLKVEGRRGNTVGPGARYLGYGVMHAYASRKKGTEAGELTRDCLPAGWTFTVKTLLRRTTNGNEKQKKREDKLFDSLRRAFIAVGIFGGLGSKSRKGWGSLALEELDGNGSLANSKTLHTRIFDATGGVYEGDSGDLPAPYTTFTKHSSIYVGLGKKGQKPLELLDELGREMVRERSWGFKGKLFNFAEKAERNYKKDHDLMKQAGRGQKVSDHPDRIAFGLPHNYGRSYKDQVEPASEDRGRRASPLFLKVHEFSTGRPGAVITFLPAQFLPPAERLRVGTSKDVSYNQTSGRFWSPILQYIGRIAEVPEGPFADFKKIPVI